MAMFNSFLYVYQRVMTKTQDIIEEDNYHSDDMGVSEHGVYTQIATK